MKLQVNVPDEPWSTISQEIADAYRDSLPEDQRALAPRSANALIPLALLEFGESLRPGILTVGRGAEATRIAHRRPGPKPKKENLSLFDDRPGAWVSCTVLRSGTSSAQVGDARLSLFGCRCESTASTKAVDEGWGVLPETRDGVPGLRFIPPGAEFTVAAPEPMAPADVGLWVSEAMTRKHNLIALADGRLIKQTLEEREAMLRQGAKPDGSVLIARLDDLADVAAMAYTAGWTCRPEARGGHHGILLIPPHIALTYEVAPGRRVAVSQE